MKGKRPTEGEIKEWWEWLYGIDQKKSPALGGKNVELNQDKSNWCLVCTIAGLRAKKGTDHNRRLDVAGKKKSILVPVFVASYTDEELKADPGTQNCQNPIHRARDFVMAHNNDARHLTLEVDGKPVKSFYCQSKSLKSADGLDIKPSQENVCGINNVKKNHKFYHAGWWCKLPHPGPGNAYKVKFGGFNDQGFSTKVTYRVEA